MAIGAEDNDGMVLDQQAASGKTHFLNHPSPDAPDGYSLLTLNTMDTNGTSIRIGNVTVADISEKSSENSEPQNRNSDTVDNESSVLSNNNSNNNHPLTPKTFLLKDNHRYDITVPDHWIYNGTYYMFDHWLGIGKNDEVIDDDAKGNGSGSTTTLNTLAGSNNTTLTAVYQAVPITGEHFSDKIYHQFLTNNTVITLSEGEYCCVPNGPVQIEKIYPDHVALKVFGFNIVRIITENATLHVGENITAGCGDSWVNLRLLKINDNDNTATFYKIYTVTGCPV
ncbi:hypothetical protein [Candidatus Nitrososphaera evergladensis]|nr:hypothetical protein [Candidatus Nitrososphaera evergladensis]